MHIHENVDIKENLFLQWNTIIICGGLCMELDKELIRVIPSERQVKFQQLEFYAFIHFTVNTFTDKEWGDGTESPEIFAPRALDTEQWVNAVKSAGMRGLILTCKHHDGFCLWDTKLTAHNVMHSPYCKDIVREVSDACRKGSIKFGVYLSPWDRNCPLYGSGKAYDDFFVGQLTELLTNYGDVFSVWFDGACGEGPNGKKQYYDWNRYYAVIRTLQTDACISVCGPDTVIRLMWSHRIFICLSVLQHRSLLFPNKKQTNPSRNGSDLSVLAPVTGLEF